MVALNHTPDLLTRMLRPDDAALSAELASHILSLDFTDEERATVEALGDKSSAGTLTPEERAEYEWYVLLGDFLAILQLKARASLKKHQSAA
jgi:hypothetical protein